jgi:hypothetical protein
VNNAQIRNLLRNRKVLIALVAVVVLCVCAPVVSALGDQSPKTQPTQASDANLHLAVPASTVVATTMPPTTTPPATTVPPAPSATTKAPKPTTATKTVTPTRTKTTQPAPASTCHPSYTGYCVPNNRGDINCPDIKHRVMVVGPDVYGLDSDHDGVGCESYA